MRMIFFFCTGSMGRTLRRMIAGVNDRNSAGDGGGQE